MQCERIHNQASAATSAECTTISAIVSCLAHAHIFQQLAHTKSPANSTTSNYITKHPAKSL